MIKPSLSIGKFTLFVAFWGAIMKKCKIKIIFLLFVAISKIYNQAIFVTSFTNLLKY